MRAVIVNGMAFGDEGKGLVTDFFTNYYNSKLVVRYNGGAQAAHNVVLPDGTHHTFSSFGSGALRGAHTHLSRFTLVSLYALLDEYEHLRRKGYNPTISIDPKCVIVTPYHYAANQITENIRGSRRHGSVGVGIGEARRDEIDGLALRLEDFYDSNKSPVDILALINQKKCNEIPGFQEIHSLSERYAPMNVYGSMKEVLDLLNSAGVLVRRATQDVLTSAKLGNGVVVFEGAQGVLLDESVGTAPHNSWTDCTFKNAETILREASISDYEKCGVFRSYYTRHGAGPFPTEDNSINLPENHNKFHDFMGPFRIGHFDVVAASYACTVSRPDYLFVTHCDRIGYPDQKYAFAYEYNNLRSFRFYANELWGAKPVYETGDPTDALCVATDLPIRWFSHGPSIDFVSG